MIDTTSYVMARRVLVVGATGAVGGAVVRSLLKRDPAPRLTLLGRRTVANLDAPSVTQRTVDVFDPAFGEPDFHELEPDGRLAATARLDARHGIIIEIQRVACFPAPDVGAVVVDRSTG